MLFTSRSAYSSTDECWRRRWLAYEAPNGTGTHGWARKSQNIPLSTGTYVHRGLADILEGKPVLEAAQAASDAYRTMAYERGLDALGDVAQVIEEQAVLIGGLVYGWGVVRWPAVKAEWDVLAIEREGAEAIAEDVTLQFRADWIGKRKTDGAVFVWNFKTLAMLDERWLKGWEIDSQVLTEAWATERQLREPVAGVIIEGLIKGTRRKDKDEFGQTIGERQQSVLCYGYWTQGNPPLVPEQRTHEYKRGKGWSRFAVGTPGHPTFDQWFDSLPDETKESFWVTVPPVYRNDARVLSKLVQIASREREIARKADECRADISMLDANFPQAEHACLWPSRCPFFDACWTPNVIDDMAGSGMYEPRVPNHPVGDPTEA